MLNQKAPHFSELKKYLDSKKYNFLVLYFYPKDNTPSCTKEACSIRDNFAELEKSKTDFKKELRDFLPKSHQMILKDFKPNLIREIKRFIL